MKTKSLLGIMMLFLCTFSFMSCDNDDEKGRKITDYKEYVLTIASKKIPGTLWSADGSNYLSDVYAVKKEQSDKWESLGAIDGFEFEKGYEYKIKMSETNYQDDSMGESTWTEYKLLEIISKEKKDSEELPMHFISEAYYKDRFLFQYRYAAEADDKELIENDLEEHSILPLDYHYLYYRGEDTHLKWIVIKDENHMLGPGIIKSNNKKPEEFPESYKLLPHERAIGVMEWTFSDESGNATDYLTFDVFFVRSSKTKSTDMMPTLAYLYRDLTEQYKKKYPEAGVKAVVVSYAIPLN